MVVIAFVRAITGLERRTQNSSIDLWSDVNSTCVILSPVKITSSFSVKIVYSWKYLLLKKSPDNSVWNKWTKYCFLNSGWFLNCNHWVC